MVDQRVVIACILAAAVAGCALPVLIRLAVPLGLIDRPDRRKRHHGSIPLVGGLVILAGVLIGMLAFGGYHHFVVSLLATAVVVVFMGAEDDFRNISVRTRLLVQTGVILLMIFSTGVYVHTLGRAFGHPVTLGSVGVPFTMIAVIGLLNAFNLADGIDGLAGCLALVSIGAILLSSGAALTEDTSVMLLLLAFSLVPFLASNSGLLGRKWKCFLGDSGSTLLGYILAWVLIDFSQTDAAHLTPAGTLWCVALPVFDTLAVMYRRIREGRSPFKPGNGHIHHLLQGAGLSSRATVGALVLLAVALALFGRAMQWLHFGPGSNLFAFGILMIAYTTITTRLYTSQRICREGSRALPSTMAALLLGSNRTELDGIGREAGSKAIPPVTRRVVR